MQMVWGFCVFEHIRRKIGQRQSWKLLIHYRCGKMIMGKTPIARRLRQIMLSAPLFKTFSANLDGRDFAVGDVHGCFTELQRALDYIGFDPAKDRLFSTGDLVNRGPESAQVLDWLRKPWFHAVCGNHEEMDLKAIRGTPVPGVNHLAHGGTWLNDVSDCVRSALADAFASLPVAIEVETRSGQVGIVHADCPFDDWKAFRAALEAPSRESDAVVKGCLWSAHRYMMRYASDIRNVHAVVHGHTTTPTMKVYGNVFYIDTGGWTKEGRFTFLNLQKLLTLSGPMRSKNFNLS